MRFKKLKYINIFNKKTSKVSKMAPCIKCGGTNGHSPTCGLTDWRNIKLSNFQTCPICSQPIRYGHQCSGKKK